MIGYNRSSERLYIFEIILFGSSRRWWFLVTSDTWRYLEAVSESLDAFIKLLYYFPQNRHNNHFQRTSRKISFAARNDQQIERWLFAVNRSAILEFIITSGNKYNLFRIALKNENEFFIWWYQGVIWSGTLFDGWWWHLFAGESMRPDGMLVLMKWEGETPYVYFFKHGLDEEKCVSRLFISIKLLCNIRLTGLEFGQFEGKASWPWLLKIIRGHRGQYAGHQGHWYFKQNMKLMQCTQTWIHIHTAPYLPTLSGPHL